jgi:hypothetical protein
VSRRSRRVPVVLLGLLLSACSSGRPEARNVGGPSVRVRGSLTVIYDGPCGAASGFVGVAARQVIFKDAAGTVIGTTKSGPSTSTPATEKCSETARYSIKLPKEAFYQIQVNPAAPAMTISYQQLQSQGFQWDIVDDTT